MTVSYEVKGNVAVLTINRPEALNALNTSVLADLKAAVSQAQADNDVYVLVITGAGKAFVAGADISQMKDFSPIEAKAFAEDANNLFCMIENLNKPSIAAVTAMLWAEGASWLWLVTSGLQERRLSLASLRLAWG
jgi:enoyl-CoA hydratase